VGAIIAVARTVAFQVECARRVAEARRDYALIDNEDMGFPPSNWSARRP
jgi:hypothetical protein